MTDDDVPRAGSDADRATRRLQLDLDDLRFENARLKASIGERQAEIVALSDRLASLQARLRSLHRVTAWSVKLRRLMPLRLLLRRR